MPLFNKLFITLLLISLALPAHAFEWRTCPKPADISTTTISRVFPDGIDINLWDAYSSNIDIDGQHWYIAIASFAAKDDSNAAYQQAQQVLNTINSEPFQVIGNDWKTPDKTHDSKVFFQCIYGTSSAPHAIVIASTKPLADEQLRNLGRNF